jgi:hypothetical protein
MFKIVSIIYLCLSSFAVKAFSLLRLPLKGLARPIIIIYISTVHQPLSRSKYFCIPSSLQQLKDWWTKALHWPYMHSDHAQCKCTSERKECSIVLELCLSSFDQCCWSRSQQDVGLQATLSVFFSGFFFPLF